MPTGVVAGPRTRPSRGGCWADICVEKTARVTNSTTVKGEADMLRHSHSHGAVCCLQMTTEGCEPPVTIGETETPVCTPMPYISKVA